jgi:transcriptional regulator with XRE-family HTH domain
VNPAVSKQAAPELRLGAAIRRRREELGWSQEGLAFESGLHRTYIGAIERGEKNLTLRNAIRVAQAMKCNASDLLVTAGL